MTNEEFISFINTKTVFLNPEVKYEEDITEELLA